MLIVRTISFPALDKFEDLISASPSSYEDPSFETIQTIQWDGLFSSSAGKYEFKVELNLILQIKYMDQVLYEVEYFIFKVKQTFENHQEFLMKFTLSFILVSICCIIT